MPLSWIQKRLFAKPVSELRGVWGSLILAARLVFLAAAEFHRDFCFERAATLAFATVISLIPLTVLFFSLAVSLGGGDQLLEIAEEKLIPLTAPDFRETLVLWLRNNITKDAFSRGLVGLVGLSAFLGLVLSAFAVVVTAERNFNRIWKVKGSRTYLQKLMVFWVVLTTSPFILSASAAIGNLLVPAGGALESIVGRWVVLRTVYSFLVPVSIGFLAFTVLYFFLPSLPVRIRSAVLGGVIAAMLWVICKDTFYLYVARTSSLYGSLAIFPLFLVFIYANWAIVLWGCEIAYVHQHLPILSEKVRDSLNDVRLPLAYVGVFLLEEIGQSFSAGTRLPSAGEVARLLGMGPSTVMDAARVLADRGILAEDSGRSGTFVLAVSPDRIGLGEVTRWLPGEATRVSALTEAETGSASGHAASTSHLKSSTAALFRKAEDAYQFAFTPRTLADLLAARVGGRPGVEGPREPGDN